MIFALKRGPATINRLAPKGHEELFDNGLSDTKEPLPIIKVNSFTITLPIIGAH